MKDIFLNGRAWRTKDDFYDAFFKGVGAPDWHGRNFGALRDSIITGQINEIELPYRIHISGTENSPLEVRNLVKDFCSLIKEFYAEGYDVDVVCQA